MRALLTDELMRIARELMTGPPRTPFEEALSRDPIVILRAHVDGVMALRFAPGQSVLLSANPDELAGKLRGAGVAVATGNDAREIVRGFEVPVFPIQRRF